MDLKKYLCFDCIRDVGLKKAAQRDGLCRDGLCSSCGISKLVLSDEEIENVIMCYFNEYNFRVGEFHHFMKYLIGPPGDMDDDSHLISPFLKEDLRKIAELFNFSVILKSPRMFLVGEFNFCNPYYDCMSAEIFEKIHSGLNCTWLCPGDHLYRVRKNLNLSNELDEKHFDSISIHDRQMKRLALGRFDLPNVETLYLASNMDICVHESRSIAGDDILLGTLSVKNRMKLLDLTSSPNDLDHQNPFESVKLLISGLMNTRECYAFLRGISEFAFMYGYDGIKYGSFFNQLLENDEYVSEPNNDFNVVLFGKPIADGHLEIASINRINLRKVSYRYSVGPLYDFIGSDPDGQDSAAKSINFISGVLNGLKRLIGFLS